VFPLSLTALREVRERFLTGLLELRLNHDAGRFAHEFRRETRRDRHDLTLRHEHQVRERRLDVAKGYEHSTFLRELHLAEVGIGAQQANALLALADESSVQGWDRPFLERVLKVADVPEHTFHWVIPPA